ncbi:related to alpha-methylacyl-coa racemase [Armillaria ostoyae]|uniref:Related to alpha-methylacyl-coa racemase n=1 Tax=Armillaria ostoyae TaxID=47428 RepID=A0A284RG14_ARMOS|nr:related to alpha-methylacyl-coa racemase [Armillaria ostoyae]
MLASKLFAGRCTRSGLRFLQTQARNEPGGIPPPLKGIKILDLTRVLAGPTATMLLADLGADVIKVEQCGKGDDTRTWNPPSAPLLSTADQSLPPESAYFLAVNRNKRSITINFKSDEGISILHKLVAQSDVLVENYISGKLAEMKLGWEDCREINPRLVYASITGYGQTGPYRKAAGYDVIIEGEPNRPPSKVGVAATDIATGLYAHGAIMAGLLSRQQTGKGVWIDCNLFETQFTSFCTKILSRPDLPEDPRFSSNLVRVQNREELVTIITDILMTKNRDEWLAMFEGIGVPYGPINNIRETFEHPQAIARKVTVEVDHPRAGKIKLVAPAVSYNGEKMPVRLPPPWLSQHTYEVLGELGYSESEIKALREKGVV